MARKPLRFHEKANCDLQTKAFQKTIRQNMDWNPLIKNLTLLFLDMLCTSKKSVNA